MFYKFFFIIIAISLILCGGCINRVPLYSCKNASFSSTGSKMSLKERTQKITLYAKNKNWNTKIIKPGEIAAFYSGVNYSCKVLIEYDKNKFNIYYISSNHMFYNPEKHSIHIQYNYLIRELENTLKK